MLYPISEAVTLQRLILSGIQILILTSILQPVLQPELSIQNEKIYCIPTLQNMHFLHTSSEAGSSVQWLLEKELNSR